MHAMTVLAIANQKGGVGKTTTAINLGTSLAAAGERVVIIDLDPQGNAGTGLGVYEDARETSTYDVLAGQASLEQAMHGTAIPGLFVAPATRDLAALERELAMLPNRAFLLRDAISSMRASDMDRNDDMRVTYVLIDCPPSLNILTINAMAAADAVLVPVQCEFFALEGVVQLKETIDFVRGTLNPDLDIHGVVLTMHQNGNKLAEEVSAEVRATFGPKVYTTIIPRNVKLAEAPSHGQPIQQYDAKSPGAKAYTALAGEVRVRDQRTAA